MSSNANMLVKRVVVNSCRKRFTHNNDLYRGISSAYPSSSMLFCTYSPSIPSRTKNVTSPTSKRFLSSNPPNSPFGGGGGIPFPNQQQNQEEQSYLSQYTTDLTSPPMIQSKKLDPLIGRHDEIRRTLQILARRTKNNPILIGEPGVGKTAIAYGLAQRIASGDVPDSMKDKKVLSLDVAGLVSGAMFRGQFEERVKGVLKEVMEMEGGVILFVDEIHLVVGAGKGSGGEMDMGNMIKPSLARGELQLVGATTLDEYRVIEKDAALARRFQSVFVSEPNVEDTVSILRGLKPRYELHHGIRIKDEALVTAATMSHRYITDRKQPDKSIDLIDEACSRLRLEHESKPEIIWKVERDLLTKQIELSALTTEEENDSQPNPKIATRKAHVQDQVNTLQTKLNDLNDIWEAEKEQLTKTKNAQKKLEEARNQLDEARNQGNFSKAGELQHSVIPRLESELEQIIEQNTSDAEEDPQDQPNNNNKKLQMLSDSVTSPSITTLISDHTGIPLTTLTSSESHRLLTMESHLQSRVIGQDHALRTISDCIRLSRTKLQDPNRTLGNFLFVGPTGVGKTELAKTLAEFLFDDEDAMTRIDMSEYGEKHTVSRLLGAPPGYVGYDEGGGLLTERVRRRPYQVLLLDEFEKGHEEVWNVLLQLFDEGVLTDSRGKKVDFRNVVVILTSNMGAEVIAQLPPDRKVEEPLIKEGIMEVVRKTLKPELLNRIDDTIVFNRLQREHMDVITHMGLNDIANRLGDGQNMTLDVSDNARGCLSDRGFDIRYGARPLKRTLAKDVLHPLSRLVLDGGVRDGDIVRIRTRAEADKLVEKGDAFGYIAGRDSTSGVVVSKNDVVIMRNHQLSDSENGGNEAETIEDGEDNLFVGEKH